MKGIFKNDWLQGNEDLELFLEEIREIFRNGTNEQVGKRINKRSIEIQYRINRKSIKNQERINRKSLKNQKRIEKESFTL